MFIITIGSYGLLVDKCEGTLDCSVRRIYPNQVEIFRINVGTRAQLWELLLLIWNSADDGDGVSAVVFDMNASAWIYAVELKGVYNILAEKIG